MNHPETQDKLKEALNVCEIHNQRMEYALDKSKSHFPLNEERYQQLSFDDLSYLDQLIFRFSKLQDAMGSRLFPAILENLGKDIEGKPFIDLLTTNGKIRFDWQS